MNEVPHFLLHPINLEIVMLKILEVRTKMMLSQMQLTQTYKWPAPDLQVKQLLCEAGIEHQVVPFAVSLQVVRNHKSLTTSPGDH